MRQGGTKKIALPLLLFFVVAIVFIILSFYALLLTPPGLSHTIAFAFPAVDAKKAIKGYLRPKAPDLLLAFADAISSTRDQRELRAVLSSRERLAAWMALDEQGLAMRAEPIWRA